MSLVQVDLLADLAGRFPDGVAWKNMADGRQLLLREWHARSNQLARGMVGARPQARRPGGPGHPPRPTARVAHLLYGHSQDRCHLCAAEHTSQPARAAAHPRPGRGEDHSGQRGLLDDSSSTAHLGALVATTGPVGASGIAWSDLLDPDPSDIAHRVHLDDVADIMYTSGTTGAPKGVVVRHGGLSSNDRVPEEWTGLGFLMGSPFSTTTGSLLVCGPMRGGMSGWFLPKFDPEGWLRLVETERPTVAMIVPAMMALLVANPYFEHADLSSLAVVSCGSAPVTAETLRRFGARIPGVEITIGYGMTEFGAATALPLGDAGKHLGSVGVPLPGVTLRIVDEDGNDRPTGEVGEVLITGERPAREYYNQPEESERTWKEGWLKSGDLGYLDADGFLWISGRSKEMIIRGGHNIMPGEVESALFTHPAVADAAVAAIPHPVLGEDVAAWVVLRSDATASAESLRAFLLERLADYKVPRRYTFVDALPRNEAGKVVKAQLVADDYAKGAS